MAANILGPDPFNDEYSDIIQAAPANPVQTKERPQKEHSEGLGVLEHLEHLEHLERLEGDEPHKVTIKRVKCGPLLNKKIYMRLKAVAAIEGVSLGSLIEEGIERVIKDRTGG